MLTSPLGGATSFAFAIPNSTVFAGAPLTHQFVQGELDALGNLASLSSSNALALVIGSF